MSLFIFIDRLHYERDLVVNLGHEAERLDKIVKEEETEIERLNNISNILARYKHAAHFLKWCKCFTRYGNSLL